MSSDVFTPVSVVRPRDRSTAFASVVTWPRILDLVIMLAAAVVILIVTRRHEPWLDEAQSWMMAREVGLKQLFFHNMRYEGNPGGWHLLLWIAIHIFGASYSTLGYIGAVPAIAGVAVLIFLAPFWRVIRYLAAFSFFIAYQYAVVARPYVLLGLFAFLVAHFYRAQFKHIYPLLASLMLLCTICAQTIIIASGIALGFALMSYREWKGLDTATRRKLLVSAVIYCLFVLLILAIMWPPKDLATKGLFQKQAFLEKSVKSNLGLITALPLPQFLTYIPTTLTNLFHISAYLSGPSLADLLLLACFAPACRYRKILFPCALLLFPLPLFYGFFYGYPHHQGITTIAVIAIAWIVAPDTSDPQLPRNTFRWYSVGMVLLGISLSIQVGWAYNSFKHDYEGSYCGAAAAADYLKKSGEDKLVIYAYDPGTRVGVLPGWMSMVPYFDRNIFVNFHPPKGQAWIPNSKSISVEEFEFDGIAKAKPDLVLVPVFIPPQSSLSSGLEWKMNMLGYRLDRIFPGELFSRKYKTSDAAIIIFRRTPPKST